MTLISAMSESNTDHAHTPVVGDMHLLGVFVDNRANITSF
jgi:hypothetical protein